MPKFPFSSDIQVLLPNGQTRSLNAYLLSSFLLMLGGLLLIISIFLPYWSMTMYAPQYPKGLKVDVYVNQLAGDVREIDALNHYLGMPSLEEGGQLERAVAVWAITALGLLLLGGVFVHNKWAAVLALPALLFPLVFLADLALILYQYGHSIDPRSPLGGAIDPFMPPLFGPGTVGQFRTAAQAEVGLYLAAVAVVVILAALWFHRAAYKPIADARTAVARSAP